MWSVWMRSQAVFPCIPGRCPQCLVAKCILSGWVMLKEKTVPWGHCSTCEVLDYVCPVPSLPQGLTGSVLVCLWGTDT